MRSPRRSLLTLFTCAAVGAAACESQDLNDGTESDASVPEPPPRVVVDCPECRPMPPQPPPISGGTLAVTAAGDVAVAADPDRGLVFVVDLGDGTVLHTLEAGGDEPGRVVVDSTHAWVALRRSGAVMRIDLASGASSRMATCASPRGLALDGAKLHVACSEGTLDTMEAATGAPVRRLHLSPDLRDVVVSAHGGLYVSRFRAAELLALDSEGRVTGRFSPPDAPGARAGEILASPNVAWRTVGLADGRIMMLHQRASVVAVSVGVGTGSSGDGGYGQPPGPEFCGTAISGTLVTVFEPSGVARTVTGLAGATVVVDVAPTHDGRSIALATPGTLQPTAPIEDEREVPEADSGLFVLTVQEASSELNVEGSAAAADPDTEPCVLLRAFPADGAPATGLQVTAVARDQQGRLYAQSREPAVLVDHRNRQIPLSSVSALSASHEVFHRDAGRGIACATCHPEGTDDGHTWLFEGHGLRRTQFLAGGLRETAPFHWAGDMTDFGTLMSEVLVNRMGGATMGAAESEALLTWLDRIPAPPPATVDAGRAERGRALFESAQVGCSACHTGALKTDNQRHDLGLGHALQTPRLRALAHRERFMHDGCADTLEDRFDPACGGESHGNVADLNPDQLGDLVEFLRTL